MMQTSIAPTPNNPAKNREKSSRNIVDKKNKVTKLTAAVATSPINNEPVALTRFHCLTKLIPITDARIPTASRTTGKIIPLEPYCHRKSHSHQHTRCNVTTKSLEQI